MTQSIPSSFVRRALLADALVSGVTGAMLVLGTSQAAQLFGLAEALLRPVGLFFIVYGAVLTWLSRAPALSRPMVQFIVVGNVLWVVASVAFMLVGPASITAIGLGFVGFQAAAVAALAEAQWLGLRRLQLRRDLCDPIG